MHARPGMDLKSGYPFWPVKNGLLRLFPPLRQDLRCDVAVIGGGITGALIAHAMAEGGHAVVVLERRDIGWGSTAASTALLQYEIDTPMTELAAQYGEDDAALAYRSCAQALHQLKALAGSLRDVAFAPMHSVYLASRPRHVARLRAECALRLRHGLPVEWLDSAALDADYGIAAPGAILSRLAAGMDPYRMTYRLFARLHRRGVAVHDRTVVADLQPRTRDVLLRTGDGMRVRATHVVVAAGYEGQQWLRQRVARNRSSYAFVTDPLESAQLAGLRGRMLWESARPYLYLRSTPDGRLIVGGEDDATDVPSRRDARIPRRAQTLVDKVARLIPGLRLQPQFSWAGTFAETRDGLPFFGPHPQYGPRVQFAMAYGGNGITFAVPGAELLRARIERRAHPLARLFSFDRLR